MNESVPDLPQAPANLRNTAAPPPDMQSNGVVQQTAQPTQSSETLTKPNPQLPTTQEMHAQLKQSGVLQQESISTAQQQRQATQNTPQEVIVPLANSGEDTTLSEVEATGSKFIIHIPKIIGIILTAQSLFGIYKSMLFIFVEYPSLENQLSSGLVERDAINGFASKAILTIISTVLSMFFALRLTILKGKTAKILNTVIGTILILSNAFITQFLTNHNASDYIATFMTSGITFIIHIPDYLMSLLPL